MNMEATTMENIFGERLKEIRNANNMSQNELANYLDITPSSLSYYENGVRNPPITILPKLVERFNVSVNWLLGINENQTINLRTYADMIRHIIPLLESSVWYIWLNDLPFDTDQQALGLGTFSNTILDFLLDYKKISELTAKSSVPEDLFRTWIDGRIQSLKDTPLPQNRSETDEQ